MDQIQTIASAINGYFELMYDADDDRFPEVFHDACLIHGLRDGKLTAWSASEFRERHARPTVAGLYEIASRSRDPHYRTQCT